MEYTQELVNQLRQEEEELQFASFSNEDAKKLGEMLYEASKGCERTVAVEIRKNGTVIYRYISDDANKENCAWLDAKANTVDKMGRSSLRVAAELALAGECLEDKKMNQVEHGLLGGGFPLSIRNVGMVGTICVSGLFHTQDHTLLVETIRKFILEGQKQL